MALNITSELKNIQKLPLFPDVQGASDSELESLAKLFSIKKGYSEIELFYQWNNQDIGSAFLGEDFWELLNIENAIDVYQQWHFKVDRVDVNYFPIFSWNRDIYVLVNLSEEECPILIYDTQEGDLLAGADSFLNFLTEVRFLREQDEMYTAGDLIGL